MTTTKKLLYLLGTLLLALQLPILSGKLTSAQYTISQSQIDGGGHIAQSSSYAMSFQSSAPIVAGVSTTDESKLVQGIHFSSHIRSIDGFNTPFERDDVTLNAVVDSTYSTKVEFFAKTSDGTLLTFPSPYDTDVNAGWSIIWDSIQTIPEDEVISIMSRAFDGLTWGPIFETPITIIVDNYYLDCGKYFNYCRTKVNKMG